MSTPFDTLKSQFKELSDQVKALEARRNEALRALRQECRHLRLVELAGAVLHTKRICVECGAEEGAWSNGYEVLAIADDRSKAPYFNERVLLTRTDSSGEFYSYRKEGPLYLVGKSHPNYRGYGQTYEKLTEVVEV